MLYCAGRLMASVLMSCSRYLRKPAIRCQCEEPGRTLNYSKLSRFPFESTVDLLHYFYFSQCAAFNKRSKYNDECKPPDFFHLNTKTPTSLCMCEYLCCIYLHIANIRVLSQQFVSFFFKIHNMQGAYYDNG